MTKIILDADLRAKLLNLTQPLVLCDESGCVRARLFPAIDLSQYESWEPPMSEEELRRREEEIKFYTTSEVLAYLENLKCSESDGNGPP